MPRASSRPRTEPAVSFPGPIIAIRFVQLVDGRRILQYSRMPNVWDTPETIDVRSLNDDERDEVLETLAAHDPNFR